MHTILMTGSTGCIGNATVAYLLEQGVERIVGFSRKANAHHIPKIWRDRVSMIAGDMADAESVRKAVLETQPSAIIHLAAFQTPDCQAFPFQGMDINVAGTMHLFKAAAALDVGLERFVCASSIAVNGPRNAYPNQTISTQDPYLPSSLYGYWKIANEGCAQAFHLETGIPTVSVRLATTYGPGRDRGMTSAPTSALKALALRVPFAMPYVGREHYHFVKDVGAGFAQCAIEPFEGYGVFNLRGKTVSTEDFIDAIQHIADSLGMPDPHDVSIAPNAIAIPFGCDFDASDTCDTFPNMPLTPLDEGIRQSLEIFMAQVKNGELDTSHLTPGP